MLKRILSQMFELVIGIPEITQIRFKVSQIFRLP